MFAVTVKLPKYNRKYKSSIGKKNLSKMEIKYNIYKD